MPKRAVVMQPHVSAPDDPLRAEHATVSAWVEAAFSSLGADHFYRDAGLKSLPSGQVLLDAEPEQARRYVLAAVAQARHFAAEAERFRGQYEQEGQQVVAHPGWTAAWGREL